MRCLKVVPILTLISVLMPAGCAEDSAGWATGPAVTPPIPSEAPSPSSHPAATPPPAEPVAQPPQPAPASDDAEVASLASRIQSFVGQLPANDLARKAGYAPKPPPVKPAASKPASSPVSAPVRTQSQSASAEEPAPTITLPRSGGSGAEASPPSVAPVDPPEPGRPEVREEAPAETPAETPQENINRDVAGASPSPAETAPHSAVAGPIVPAPADTPPAAETQDIRPTIEVIDIRPAMEPATTIDTSVKAPVPNQPVTEPSALAASSADAASSAPTATAPAATVIVTSVDITSLMAQLEATVKDNPQQLDDQFRLRLLYLVTGQAEKATEGLESDDPMRAALLSAAFRTMDSIRQAVQKPTESAGEALLAVDELHRLLSQQSSVVIPKIALVTWVNSFGAYGPVDPPTFQAGKGVHVFLYTEVANFRSEPTPDGRVRTLLSEKVEVFNSTGEVIWQRTEPHLEDRVLSPRRDFFIPLEVRLPSETPIGEYVLKVTIEDKIGATTDQRRMTFSIVQ